jgi:hypothetical protein
MDYQMPDGIGSTDSASLDDAFTSVLSATIITDDDDNNLSNGTPHLKEILDAFALHNISLSRFINISTSKVSDQDTAASAYNITVKASYNGIVGELDNQNVKVFYSIDNGKTYNSVQLKSAGNTIFEGQIPKVAPFSIVKYYASATSTLSEDQPVYSPLPSQPYHFLVGFRRISMDDAEQERGWSLQSAGDNAARGLWIRGKPHGTYSSVTPPIQYIQQDTDHSAYPGTMCYVTGNKIDPQGAGDPNFAGFDDVDSGVTTLMTPVLDLSMLTSPVIRYWYYYSNDQGQNSRIPQWQTDISGDNGSTWKSLQLTGQSTNGWTAFIFRVEDHIAASSTVRIRFIASDFVQSLVEAGVDDLEILEAIGDQTRLVTGNESKGNLPYPNPIHRGEKLHISEHAISSVSLIDILGRTVFHADQAEDDFVITRNINPGLYFIDFAGQRSKIVIEP